MAIVLVNKDGTSNAKAGDIVVTGGGLYRKNEDGTSTKVGGLNTSSGTSKSYSDVLSTFSQLVGGSGGTKTVDTTTTVQPDLTVQSVDDNGLVTTTPGYDPNEYVSYKTTSSSSGLSTIMGYVILGLVGIALLDRFMNSSKK